MVDLSDEQPFAHLVALVGGGAIVASVHLRIVQIFAFLLLELDALHGQLDVIVGLGYEPVLAAKMFIRSAVENARTRILYGAFETFLGVLNS